MRKKLLSVALILCMMLGLFIVMPASADVDASVQYCYYEDRTEYVIAGLELSGVASATNAYLAIYDENNKLIKMKQEVINPGLSTYHISLFSGESYKGFRYKVFLWDAKSYVPEKDAQEGVIYSRHSSTEENLLSFINAIDEYESPELILQEVLLECAETGIIDASEFAELTDEEQIAVTTALVDECAGLEFSSKDDFEEVLTDVMVSLGVVLPSRNYGFVTAVGKNTEYGENIYKLKMFTMDGTVTEFTIAEQLYVYQLDGVEYKISGAIERSSQGSYFEVGGRIYDAVYSPDSRETGIASIPERFIAYELNSAGEIISISFAEGDKANNEFNHTVGTGTYNEKTGKFGGKLIGDNSILLYAEPDYDGVFDEDRLALLSFSYLDPDEFYYSSYLFDITTDNEIGVAVVPYGISVNRKSALAIVTAISTTSDYKKKISFYQKGKSLSYIVDDTCDDLNDLAVGDIFQYLLSGEKIYLGLKIADYNQATQTISLTPAAAYASGVITYAAGEVDEKEAKYIVVDGTDYVFGPSDEVGTKVVYDTERSGKNVIRELMSLSSLKKSGSTYTYNVILKLNDGDIVDAIEYQTATVFATAAPATSAPSTSAPSTAAPATDAPATDAPATDAPA